jgi:hypothetical protein
MATLSISRDQAISTFTSSLTLPESLFLVNAKSSISVGLDVNKSRPTVLTATEAVQAVFDQSFAACKLPKKVRFSPDELNILKMMTSIWKKTHQCCYPTLTQSELVNETALRVKADSVEVQLKLQKNITGKIVTPKEASFLVSAIEYLVSNQGVFTIAFQEKRLADDLKGTFSKF